MNSEHSLSETSFENPNEFIVIKQEGRLCITRMFTIILTEAEPIDNKSKAF